MPWSTVTRRWYVVGRDRRGPPVHLPLLMQSTVEPVDSDEENAAPDDSPAGVASRVKLHVIVPAPEIERAIDAAFRKLAREVRVPGFRPGKAPRRLLEARLGTDIAREQALRDSLPDFYVDAVTEHDVDVIAPPEIEVTAGQDDGDVAFEAVAELDQQLHGTRPGASLEFSATLPERFGERAGEEATFRVLVKEAKHKVLPELNDEWVDEASEFDTVDELRADIRKRLEVVQKLQA